MNGVVASALLICPVASVAAGGQTPDSSAGNGSSLQLVVQPIGAEAPAYVAFSVEHLLGDPGGIRINLEIQGVYGEGFRMPSGVRKPPKHEPAGRRRWSMGIWGFAGSW